jgi:hypothetical protein
MQGHFGVSSASEIDDCRLAVVARSFWEQIEDLRKFPRSDDTRVR